MVMGDTLLAFGWHLITVALEMAGSLGRHRNAIEPLSGMRGAARPYEEDEHQSAEDGRQSLHRTLG